MREQDIHNLLSILGFIENDNYSSFEAKINSLDYSLEYTDNVLYMDNLFYNNIGIHDVEHINYIDEDFKDYDELYYMISNYFKHELRKIKIRMLLNKTT